MILMKNETKCKITSAILTDWELPLIRYVTKACIS